MDKLPRNSPKKEEMERASSNYGPYRANDCEWKNARAICSVVWSLVLVSPTLDRELEPILTRIQARNSTERLGPSVLRTNHYYWCTIHPNPCHTSCAAVPEKQT